MATASGNLRVYRTVILGALLHDIGKFLQRGTFPGLRIEGRHPKVSADFIRLFKSDFGQCVDPDLLEVLVQRHHEHPRMGADLLAQEAPQEFRGYAYLVSRADNLSSYERGARSEQTQDYKNTPLVSIFPTLSVSCTPSTATLLEHGAFQVGQLDDLQGAFPREKAGYQAQELNRLLESFGEAFMQARRELSQSGSWPHFDIVLSHLLVLLERFSSSIPANTQEEVPDVSLFDHLRTTAAIAACLYKYHPVPGSITPDVLNNATGPEFLLVGGDASGIQSYIFEVAHGRGGSVARRLRARSLHVQAIVESVADRLLERLDLPPVNRLIASGGKFYLLAPNTSEARATLEETREQLAQWCLDELSGELTIHLAWAPINSSGFRGEHQPDVTDQVTFGDHLVDLNVRLAQDKQRRFRPGPDGQPWGSMLLADPYHGRQPCVSCGRMPQVEGDPDELCQQCRSHMEAGRALPRARLLRISPSEGSGLPVFCGVVEPLPGPATLRSEDTAILLNSWDTEDYARRPVRARFLAHHVPVDGQGAPLTFEEIAAKAHGRRLLGFLKADVDNLGETFAFGLQWQGRRRDTVSRIATLSRMLDLFFSGWIERLLSTEFQLCYTVFSGGDDLFVIGPWDQILDLAKRVREDFRRWVGRDDLTLSAGLVFGSDHLPMPQASRQAEDALERAKDAGRDRITLLGRQLPWDRYSARVLGRWRGLLPAIQGVSTASLYRLLALGRMWETYLANPVKNASALRAHPLLAYSAARDKAFQTHPFDEWLYPALHLEPLSEGADEVLDNMALVAELLIYSKRKEAES